jgi:alpha-glucoside transport system permease protein
MSGFLQWIAGLPPLAQIPLVVLAFLAVVALVLFFIEIAPRSGKVYTAIRLAVCILAPAIVFLVLGSVWWAAAVAAVLGGVFFVLDYRSKEGSGYLFQLIGFLSPAVILLLVGLIYPTISTFIAAFMNNRSDRFVGFDNFVWIFTQETGIRTVLNTIIWVLVVPTVSTIFGLAYAVFID